MRISLLTVIFLVSAAPVFAGDGKAAEYLRQGNAFLQAHDYQDAVEAFRKAARLAPESAEAHRNAGMAYLKLGSNEGSTNPEMLDNASAAFKEALRIEPDSAEVHYELGVVDLLLYDKADAVKEYETLTHLDANLAKQLLSRINGYAAPLSFRSSENPHSARESNTTPVSIVHNAVLVPVRLTRDGKTVEATLVLDTGASVTVINRNIAEELDIDLDKAGRAKYKVVGGVIRGWHTKIDSVAVGAHSRPRVEIAIVEGAMFDGLLGMDFLRTFNYSIDFTNQVINWSQR